MLDALVIGAGPAGLTCALYLARFHRSLLLADAGDSRARYIPVSHNTPGFARGVAGAELLEELREQAARYGAVPEAATVRSLRQADGGFSAEVGGRDVLARHVVLATGLVDTLPTVPGVDQAIHEGRVRLCPVCDAFETSGRRVLVYGPPDAAARHARYLRSFSESVAVAWLAGQSMTAQDRAGLDAAGVQVLGPLAELSLQSDAIAVVLEDGRRARFDLLYPFLGAATRSGLATALGAACEDDGQLRVDHHQQTSVDGLYAIGDVVGGLNQISVAVGHAARAATHIHNRLPFRPYRA